MQPSLLQNLEISPLFTILPMLKESAKTERQLEELRQKLAQAEDQLQCRVDEEAVVSA